MKSHKSHFRGPLCLGLILGALLCAALPSRAQYNAIVDPAQSWEGYLSYSGGATGSNAPLADLQSFFLPQQVNASRLLLQINTNSYPWLPLGDTVESDTYVDTETAEDGQTVSFSGMVESNSIPAVWQVFAYIKDWTSGFGSIVQNPQAPLVSGAPFNLSTPNPVGAGDILEYGFTIYGSNAAPGSVYAKYAASIITSNPPATMVTLHIDPTQSWQGALNYYTTSSGYLSYFPGTFPVSAVPATFVPSQASASRLLLGINTSTYDATATNDYDDDTINFFNGASGSPVKYVECDAYINGGTQYGGNTVVFTGTVESNTIPVSPWVVYCFIKEYTGAGAFLSTAYGTVPSSGTFSVEKEIAAGDRIEYGFYIGGTAYTGAGGPNTAPGSPNSLQMVSFIVGSGTTITPVKITATRNGANINLAFQTQNGVTYTVLYKARLTDASWTTLTTVNGDGNVDLATDTLPTTGTRYYRVSAP